MSINDRIAVVEEPMDGDDVVSVVHGVERLRALLAEVTGPDADRVRVALCRWLRALDRPREVADRAQEILASPTAVGINRLWGRYWAAHARALLVDDAEPPMGEYGEVLDALESDLSAEATDLGNRAWSPQSRLWSTGEFLNAYVRWAKPRFATADRSDQWVIVQRISEHVDRLSDSDPATAVVWLDEVLGWPSLTATEWRVVLRSRLARTLFVMGDFARARDEYQLLAGEADGDDRVVLQAQLQAARALAKRGDQRAAARELEHLGGARRRDDYDIRKVRAQARGELVGVLLDIDPKRADLEALATWRDFKDDPDPAISHLAGLAVASSWRELEPTEIATRATWIIKQFPTPVTSDLKTLVVLALNSRTNARAESGDEAGAVVDAEAALNLADDEVPDFVIETAERNQHALRLRRGDYADRDEIYGVVRQLLDAADAASKRGDRESSSRDYWRGFEMANPSPDPATRLAGLAALRNWTFDLLAAREDARAAEIARLGIDNGIDDGQVGTELLAQAWLDLGVATNRLADKDTADYALAQASSVIGDSTVATHREIATLAAWNRAVILDDGSRPDTALQAYHQLINRIGPNAGIAQQRRAAKALKNCAVILREELNRPADSAMAWTEIVSRFGAHPDPELARLVTEARTHVLPPKRRGLFKR